MNVEEIKLALMHLSPENKGVYTKDLANYMKTAKNVLNPVLYNNQKKGQHFNMVDPTELPPRWTVVLCTNDTSKQIEKIDDNNKIEQLVLIDLGNVHKCFEMFTTNVPGQHVVAFADFCYNIDSLLRSFPNTELTFESHARYYFSDGRILIKARCMESNLADALLIDYFYRLLRMDKLEKNTAHVIIASKDKFLSAFSKVAKQYVKYITIVYDMDSMRQEL